MTKQVDVFRSAREEGLYVYLAHGASPDTLPEALLRRFGKPELAMTISLEPGKKLARAEASAVLDSIESQGFYLQLPPSLSDSYTRDVRQANNKLGKS